MLKYDIVLSDPPWEHYGSQDKWGAAAKFYETHSEQTLLELARPPLARPGVLFLWTTSSQMAIAIKLIEDWGLHYRGVGFIWVKTTADGVPWKARGVRPSIIKPLTEFVLCASMPAKGRPLKIKKGGEAVVQTVFAPVREHSRKPDEVLERINQLYDVDRYSRLEMFAREGGYPGWDVWGDEVDKFDA